MDAREAARAASEQNDETIKSVHQPLSLTDLHLDERIPLHQATSSLTWTWTEADIDHKSCLRHAPKMALTLDIYEYQHLLDTYEYQHLLDTYEYQHLLDTYEYQHLRVSTSTRYSNSRGL